MKTRLIRAVGFALIALGLTDLLSAGDLCGSVAREVKRRQCWPDPFTAPDRADARAPFALMVNNGWRRQNLLGDAYFDAETGKLKQSGLLKIRWVLTECPEHHRIVYVHIGDTEEETTARIIAAQQEVARLAPQMAHLVPVLPTAISDVGWPADEVDTIMRAYQKSAPVPRLPTLKDSTVQGGNK